MRRNPLYRSPKLVYRFEGDKDYIIISSGEDYFLENYVDFFLFKFSIESDITLHNEMFIYPKSVPFKLDNFKFTEIGIVILYLFFVFFSCIMIPKIVHLIFQTLNSFYYHFLD